MFLGELKSQVDFGFVSLSVSECLSKLQSLSSGGGKIRVTKEVPDQIGDTNTPLKGLSEGRLRKVLVRQGDTRTGKARQDRSLGNGKGDILKK